jgi:outer membrane protein TolC
LEKELNMNNMQNLIRKTVVSVSWIILFVTTASAQNSADRILASIEENNTTLKALKENVEAQKLENKTGIFLPNPEIEFNYLWGHPGSIGNRTDIIVSQTFDIPTITGMKSRLAQGKNDLIEWQYKSDRINILREAKQYCIELIYYNALKKETNTRLSHAETIAEGFRKRLEQGDANNLEYNKAQLNLSAVQGETARIEIERKALLSELQRLNGGEDVVLEDVEYKEDSFPLNFEEWYRQAGQKSPVLEYVKREVEVKKKQVGLSKAMGLPAFSAGYMSEKVVGEQFQGITLGISIPLWENKNRVRQAKAAAKAAEVRQTDTEQQFYYQLQTLYERAAGLKNRAAEYRKSLISLDNTALLKKALDAGEISLMEYILEIGLYYETVNQSLAAERDFQKAFAELLVTEL